MFLMLLSFKTQIAAIIPLSKEGAVGGKQIRALSSLQPFALLWFFGSNHPFQFWGRSQCLWIWPPEEMPPFLRALAQFPITPSLLILLHGEKPFPKFYEVSIMLHHPSNTEIYNPNEISSCQPKKGSFSHHILPDHSHSLFLRIFLDFRIVIFLYIYTQNKRLLANSKHIISTILSCAIYLPLQWEPKKVLQIKDNFSFRKSYFTRHATR